MPRPDPKQLRVLAVASGGGHWIQLRRLRPAWEGMRVTYMTTVAGYAAEVAADDDGAGFVVVPDANRWQKLRLVRQLLAIAWTVARLRPHAVVTTGAAPGYFALRLGKLLGARTVWVDSMANAEELSLSGRKAGPHAELFLTQWPHLARPDGPHHAGGRAVIFLTVGTQLPFDRLVRAVDDWAAARGRRDIFGQIAEPGPAGYRPRQFPFTAHLPPAEFEQRCREAVLIVAHAGMGSLITAMTFRKPILVMPRRGALGEHRNDHQFATAQKLGDRPGVAVVLEARELGAKLDAMLAEGATGGAALPPFAEASLIAAVRRAILG